MSIKEDNILTKAISKKISRRSFIKWSGALGATASMSGLVMQAGTKVAMASGSDPVTTQGGAVDHWRPSCCLVCHSWCHIAAGIDVNGHVRKIEGAGGQPMNYIGTSNPIRCIDRDADGVVTALNAQYKKDDANHIATPAGFLAYAPHNKGRICAKGNDGVEHLYDPDRIKYPLKRVGKRGEGLWQRMDWDDAYTIIANKLRTLAQDNHQHRFVMWVGRDENGTPKDFSKAYGTPNHVEHTSLCELSRHVAGRSLWGHHWSSVDLQEHANVTIKTDGWDYASQASWDATANFTLDRNLHDIDCYIEWGGNPAEAKIPHSSCANHLGDRRRSNLKGYIGPNRLGRIINIDVRQSNTGAFADENIQIVPGTDGALALGIFYGVFATAAGGSTGVREDLDKGHNGTEDGTTTGVADYTLRRYYGLFEAEEVGGVASGDAATAVAPGQSLESYLFELNGRAAVDSFYDHISATTPDWGTATTGVRARVSAITGASEDTIDYLVALLNNGNGAFKNVVIDGYRGPAKHTNGVYNYRAIRSLQYIAPNASAATYFSGGQTVPRGGYNAPGAFQSDKNWDPYRSGVPAAKGSVVLLGSAASGITLGSLPGNTACGGQEAAPSSKMRIDQWDYERGYDTERWRGSYKWVDQNLTAGIRHSLGLSAFVKGASADGQVDGPYASEATFKVEALMTHKNSPTYSRAQQDLEIEMLTKTDSSSPTGYRLENFWAIDIAMGDGTRFADIILPDVTYLERYTPRSGEGQEFNYRDNVFYRLPVYEIEQGEWIGNEWCPRHMYDSRQVRAIFYELARTIETSITGIFPWYGSLYSSFVWSDLDTGVKSGNPAYVNDGEWAIREKTRIECEEGGPLQAAATTLAVGVDGFDLIRSHGMIWSSIDGPAYWRRKWAGPDNTAGTIREECRARTGAWASNQNQYQPAKGYKPYAPTSWSADIGNKFTVYNEVLATMPDVADGVDTVHTRNDGSGHFYGTPVYVPVTLQTTGTHPTHLTTYKLNVHTQSRTACLPRLNEIIGNSWAVLPVTGYDGGGVAYHTADNGVDVYNGVVVTVKNTAGQSIQCVAKVTEKAQENCVHISHSQGHQRGIWTIASDGIYSNTDREAFGTFKVRDTIEDPGLTYHIGRKADRTLNNPSPSPCDDYAVNDVPPSAPGKGTHPNKIILHHVAGAASGANYATDPIGGSQGWFDTKVRVEG